MFGTYYNVFVGKLSETIAKKQFHLTCDHPMLCHKKYPFIIATPDFIGKIGNEFAIVEIKSNVFENEKALNYEQPEIVYIQTHKNNTVEFKSIPKRYLI